MTIITKPVTEKKMDKQPLVDNETNEALPLPMKDDAEMELPPPLYLAMHSRARRVSTATSVCVFVTTLLVLTIGIIGGVYLYHQFARTKMQRFRGFCSVPFDSDGEKVYSSRLGRPEGLMDAAGSMNEDSTETTGPLYFQEEFEIDIEYEQIDVPDFSGGRRGRFIHDFSANKTGIIDLDGHRCFVMPLNRSRILPPNSLLDLVIKMRAGYYEVDTEVVRETMRVVRPRITDYSSLGFYIARECSRLPTFKLERVTRPIVKRSLESVDSKLVFAEFAGNKISQLVIEE